MLEIEEQCVTVALQKDLHSYYNQILSAPQV